MKNRTEVKKNNRLLIFMLKILFFCLIILIPLLFLYITCRLDHVMIEGSSHYTEKELKEKILTEKTDGNAVLFYLRYRYGKVKPIPFIEDIDVKLVNKNTVKIHVYEKIITGCIEYMGGYMYFDKDGIVVESSDSKLNNVPFVTGLSFENIILYKKLEVQKKSMFKIILNLTQLIQKFDLDIKTIQFNSDLEVTLYGSNSKILLGKRNFYDEPVAELKNILPKLKGKKFKGKQWLINLIDFTEGQEIIIVKPIE